MVSVGQPPVSPARRMGPLELVAHHQIFLQSMGPLIIESWPSVCCLESVLLKILAVGGPIGLTSSFIFARPHHWHLPKQDEMGSQSVDRSSLTSNSSSPSSIRQLVYPSNALLPLSPTSNLEPLPVRGHVKEPFGEQTPLTTTNLEGKGPGGLSLQDGLYPSSSAFPQRIGPAQQPVSTGSNPHPPELNSLRQPTNLSPQLPASQYHGPTGSMFGFLKAPGYSYSGLYAPFGDGVRLSPGAIAGIAVGVAFLVLFLSALFWYLFHRRARLRKRSSQKTSDIGMPQPNIASSSSSNQSFFSLPSERRPSEPPGGSIHYSNRLSVIPQPLASSYPNRASLPSQRTRFSSASSQLAGPDHELGQANPTEVISHSRRETWATDRNSKRNSQFDPSSRFMKFDHRYEDHEVGSEQDHIADSLRSRITSFGSHISTSSVVFPEVTAFRRVSKNELGIPIQNIVANRIKSPSIGQTDYETGHDILEPETRQDIDDSTLNGSNQFSFFNLLPFGDLKKDNRPPTTSLYRSTTNFSYPIPRPPSPIYPAEVPEPEFKQDYRIESLSPQSHPETPTSSTNTQPESTPPASSAAPSFAKNRYLQKGRKKKPNAHVVSILINSSRQKSVVNSQALARQSHQVALYRTSTSSSINSFDVPDPYVYCAGVPSSHG
ncbi:hypothetical protein O181_022186 [Austropuccinia psidii MF-1]|uniref:Uncharacterized protein n=1 Tax=Austropuccinia psidii MF-1 TaxID=1389203 RepID=A0A9Q3GWG2_9BASI|nr:hypothetical protein [Austropuccinia psidii MF-1]